MTKWSRYPGDRSYLKDHPLMAGVEPEEIKWCEDCGASKEFCECPYNEPYEEEKEKV